MTTNYTVNQEANDGLSGIFYLDIYKYSRKLNACSIHFKYHGSQTKKENMTIASYKGFLGTCIKSKKRTYIQYALNQLVKILQTVSSHLALQYVKEVFPDMYSSSILSRKCQRINLYLKTTRINAKEVQS